MSLESNIADLVSASTQLTQAVNITRAEVDSKQASAVQAAADIVAVKDAVVTAAGQAATSASQAATSLSTTVSDYAAQKVTKGLAAIQTSAEQELADRLHRRDPARYPFRGVRPSLVMDFVRQECHRQNGGALEQVDLNSFMTFTRSSTATFTGPDGVLRTAAVNQPRYEYDPVTGECLGLLVEEQRTNLLEGSAGSFNRWDLCGVDPRRSNVMSPEGGLNAYKLTERDRNGISEYYMRSLSNTMGALGQSYCASVYVHESSNRTPRLRVTHINCALQTTEISFVFSTRTFGSSYGYVTSTGYSEVGNGWVRIWMVYTLPKASSTEWGLNVLGGTTIGDGVSGVLMYGPQLELGAFPTSYIPTPATFTGRASTATYLDSNGVLQTAASGVARSAAYDYDADGVLRPIGLLLESAATNLFIMSEPVIGGNCGGSTSAPQVSNSPIYGVSAISVTGNDYVSLSGSSGSPVLQAGTYCFSLISTSPKPMHMYLISDYAVSTVKKYSSIGLYQHFVIVNITTETTVWPHIRNASGHIVSMFMLESGNYPTSYIKTNGSQVTRAADTSTSAQVTRGADTGAFNKTSWFNPNQGSFSMRTKRAGDVDGIAYLVAGPDDANTRFLYNNNNTDKVGAYNGTDTVIAARNTNSTLENVSAMTFTINRLTASMTDGGIAIGKNTTKKLMGADTFYIGQRLGGYYNSLRIKNLIHFPRALSDTDLQALTILED